MKFCVHNLKIFYVLNKHLWDSWISDKGAGAEEPKHLEVDVIKITYWGEKPSTMERGTITLLWSHVTATDRATKMVEFEDLDYRWLIKLLIN